MLAKLYVLLKKGDGPSVRDCIVTTALVAFVSAVAFSLFGLNVSHTIAAISGGLPG